LERSCAITASRAAFQAQGKSWSIWSILAFPATMHCKTAAEIGLRVDVGELGGIDQRDSREEPSRQPEQGEWMS
jgi:hypothetical protein